MPLCARFSSLSWFFFCTHFYKLVMFHQFAVCTIVRSSIKRSSMLIERWHKERTIWPVHLRMWQCRCVTCRPQLDTTDRRPCKMCSSELHKSSIRHLLLPCLITELVRFHHAIHYYTWICSQLCQDSFLMKEPTTYFFLVMIHTVKIMKEQGSKWVHKHDEWRY